MGIYLGLKSYTDTSGKSQLEIKVRSRGQHFSKPLFKINRNDWDAKLLRIKSTSPVAAKYNPQLSEIKESLYNSWDMYSANMFTFDELKRRINGGSSKLDMESFAESVYVNHKEATRNNVTSSLRAFKKYLGTESILFTDCNYTTLTGAISKMKGNLSPRTINTYITIISGLYNEAYRRGIVTEKFVMYKQYKQKQEFTTVKVVESETFNEAIDKIYNLYTWQSLAFYLLSFCTRGLYSSDLVKLHLDETLNATQSDAKRYFLHKRSKTNEPMDIRFDLEPIEDILNTLQKSIIHTHNIDNRGTYKLFNYDPDNYRDHRNTWGVYIGHCKRLLGLPMKTSRKTFESIAIKLDISSALRYRLLGHADNTIKRHYIDWQWQELRDKVDAAHIQVLEQFNTMQLWTKLRAKYYAITNDDEGLYINVNE